MKTLEDKAKGYGFDDAATIDTNQLIFDFSLRKYCEDNVCGMYGANYACPPSCGTPEEMKEKALHYEKVLVLRKSVSNVNFNDREKIKEEEKNVRRSMMDFKKQLEQDGYAGLVSMPGECHLCQVCELEYGRECRSPENIASCVSAYSISMKEVAELCGWHFSFEDGKIAFFCLFFYEEACSK